MREEMVGWILRWMQDVRTDGWMWQGVHIFSLVANQKSPGELCSLTNPVVSSVDVCF